MVRGPLSLVVVGVVALGAIAVMVSGGPAGLARLLPAAAQGWIEGMASGRVFAGDQGGDLPQGDPVTHLQDSSDGWKPDDQIAAMPGGGAAYIAQVLTAQKTRLKTERPADVVALAEVEGCSFTPPTAGAKVGHAAIRGESGMDLALATYGDSDLAQAVQVLVNVYRSRGTVTTSTLSGLVYESYDIAVTETAAPVYLVLETGPQSRVFNIHLAPGARLERVVLIGGDQVGVANVPADVPVEALRAEAASACGLQPFYALNPGHLFFQSIASGAIPPDEAEAKTRRFAELAAAWDAAFRKAFGIGATEGLAGGWAGGTVAVVGPLPDSPGKRAVYAPIQGALLRVTQDRYVEFEGQAPDLGFDARVKAIATAFAWGDLKNLAQGAAY